MVSAALSSSKALRWRRAAGKKHTTAEPMVIHLAGVAFDVIMLGRSLGDFEVCAWDHNVGGIGATRPFLTVGAVAQGCEFGLSGEFILDSGTHAGAFGHCGRLRERRIGG